MVLLLDLLLVAVFALCVVSGYKNGLVKTVVRLFGGLISFFVARFAASALAPSLAAALPTISLGEKAASSVNNALMNSDAAVTIGELLQKLGMPGSVVSDLSQSVSSSLAGTAEQAANRFSSALTDLIAYGLVFIAAFLVCGLLLRLLCVWLDIFSKVPVVKTANQILGGLFGILSGLFFAWLTAVAISWLAPMAVGFFGVDFSALDTGRTYIFQYLAGYNPFSALFSAS
jgi:uncharacterized membrane protein required for colicin V production